MPADLTIFAAKYLVYIAALITAVLLIWILPSRARPAQLRWLIACVVMLVLSYVFAKIGAAVYNDPRPFTIDHVKPLIAHGSDNGFPSDHALLAAALVAALTLAGSWWAIAIAVFAVLVDWARVGAGIHHVGDVVGSSLFVLAALVIAYVVAPVLTRWLAPRLPAAWLEPTPRPAAADETERGVS